MDLYLEGKQLVNGLVDYIIKDQGVQNVDLPSQNSLGSGLGLEELNPVPDYPRIVELYHK